MTSVKTQSGHAWQGSLNIYAPQTCVYSYNGISLNPCVSQHSFQISLTRTTHWGSMPATPPHHCHVVVKLRCISPSRAPPCARWTNCITSGITIEGAKCSVSTNWVWLFRGKQVLLSVSTTLARARQEGKGQVRIRKMWSMCLAP
jgi:hypothetical protein